MPPSCLALALLAVSAALSPAAAAPLRHILRSPLPASHTPFSEFERTGQYGRDDPLAAVRGGAEAVQGADDAAGDALVELGAEVKVRAFCEICIMAVQMKERAEPHICAGLNANYYTTCVEILESLLRADKAVVYWLKNGCMHMDATGPEIVRPCPALPICSWTPNLFAAPPSLVRDGVESLCPKDPKYLPTIPNEYRTITNPTTMAAASAGPTQTGNPST